MALASLNPVALITAWLCLFCSAWLGSKVWSAVGRSSNDNASSSSASLSSLFSCASAGGRMRYTDKKFPRCRLLSSHGRRWAHRRKAASHVSPAWHKWPTYGTAVLLRDWSNVQAPKYTRASIALSSTFSANRRGTAAWAKWGQSGRVRRSRYHAWRRVAFPGVAGNKYRSRVLANRIV